VKSDRREFLGCLAALPFLAAAKGARAEGEPEAPEFPVASMERLAGNVWIAPIATGIWVTCFTGKLSGVGWYPANGLIVAGEDGATIVDTGWDAAQGKILLAAALLRTGKVARAVATHYHGDRTGGIAAMKEAGIPTFANPLSVVSVALKDKQVPQPVKGLEKDAVRLGPVELYFPGAGHSLDNIVVWHPASRTLFGGCLLKSSTAKDLGNARDGNIGAYASTIERVARRYASRRRTIPGHGTMLGDAIASTRTLLAAR